MFEVLVFMFENYFANHAQPDNEVLTQELSAAGFTNLDISGAVSWYDEMQMMLALPAAIYCHKDSGIRIFANTELKKINTESISFILFLQQANIINDVERDLIIDRAMALKQEHIRIEEMRWITMIALWNTGREKDYLFVEDAMFNPRGLTIH
jgi:Smg protein